MDSLERQMEHQRQEIERTLNQLEGSGRRRTALGKLRSSLPGIIPGRASGTSPRGPGERDTATEKPKRNETRSGIAGPQEGVERPWWRRVFGG
jgi:hypothetical protein